MSPVPHNRPLIVHVVYRFDMGGLQNGIANLINHLPPVYRHAIVSLTDITDFRQQIRRDDVDFISLHKPPGHGLWLYPRLFKLFRQLRPAIVHSRNLAALEVVVPAWLAGVPVRIHGEHGRDMADLHGSRRRYQWLRRLYSPFVNHWLALSRDLRDDLVERARIPAGRITQVYNGVDVARFAAASEWPSPIPGCPFDARTHWLIGTVGRMQEVKHPLLLARAFVELLTQQPALRATARLVMVGDGPLRAPCQALLDAAGLTALTWLPGERSDVPAIMRGLHCFVLPSLAEGISNTILEAMASGLPVIATAVGGNADLVRAGITGDVVPSDDSAALAAAIGRLARDPAHARALGAAGRRDAEQRFSLPAMVATYQAVYDRQRAAVGTATPRR